jgi:hypothetical protein
VSLSRDGSGQLAGCGNHRQTRGLWTPSFAQGDRQFVGKGGLASTVYAVDRYPQEGTMGQRRDARNYFRNQLSLWIV